MGQLKMSDQHFAALQSAIQPLDSDARRQQYRDGDFPRADKVKDLNMRYRWDLFWGAKGYDVLRQSPDGYESGQYYDSHIDSALRKIVPAL